MQKLIHFLDFDQPHTASSLEYRSRGILNAIEGCLRRVQKTVRDLHEKRANYFGIFRASVYVQEIDNLALRLRDLTGNSESSHSQVKGGTGARRRSGREEGKRGSGAEGKADVSVGGRYNGASDSDRDGRSGSSCGGCCSGSGYSGSSGDDDSDSSSSGSRSGGRGQRGGGNGGGERSSKVGDIPDASHLSNGERRHKRRRHRRRHRHRRPTSPSSSSSPLRGRGRGRGRGAAAAAVDVESVISDVAAKAFWLRSFGRRQYEVGWRAFAAAFTQQWGQQQPVSMDKLRARLCRTPPSHTSRGSGGGGGGGGGGGSGSGGGSGGESEDGGTVDVFQFDTFAAAHGGVYQSFQMLVDPAKAVYVLGSVQDESGCLPVSRPAVVEALLGIDVCQVSCGGQHASVLTRTGAVYTWGRGSFGRLGHGNDRSCAEPRVVSALSSVTVCQVACGFAYTACVTQRGQLFTWGAGENGRLGSGDCRDRNTPAQVLLDVRVCQIFAGSVHTCALTKSGEIYSFGKHEYTGHGSDCDVLLPRLLDAFQGKHVCQISVGPGGYHTIALSVTGEVFTWGHNRVGQLGFPRDQSHQSSFFLPTPQLVTALQPLRVCQVVAGWGHSAVLTSDGMVYMCGRNYRGQLGLGDPATFPRNERGHPYLAEFSCMTRLTRASHRAVQLACGGEHSAALLESGQVVTCGSGEKGQLGHGDSQDQHYPRLMNPVNRLRRQVLQVACGNNCTVILAGPFTAAPLAELCMEVIASTPQLLQLLPQVGLPSDIVQRISQYTPPDVTLDEDGAPIYARSALSPTSSGDGDSDSQGQRHQLHRRRRSRHRRRDAAAAAAGAGAGTETEYGSEDDEDGFDDDGDGDGDGDGNMLAPAVPAAAAVAAAPAASTAATAATAAAAGTLPTTGLLATFLPDAAAAAGWRPATAAAAAAGRGRAAQLFAAGRASASNGGGSGSGWSSSASDDDAAATEAAVYRSGGGGSRRRWQQRRGSSGNSRRQGDDGAPTRPNTTPEQGASWRRRK